MTKLKIVWTETALVVFQQMLTFYDVRKDCTKYSRSVYKNDTLRLIAKYPLMYRTTSIENIRVFHCDYFKTYYRILDTQILVEVVFG